MIESTRVDLAEHANKRVVRITVLGTFSALVTCGKGALLFSFQRPARHCVADRL